MHITAPNYTQIPNVVFDYWMHILSHVEFKILLAICRKTFGWHKDRDSLSIKQIMQMTGINGRSTVCNALKKLEDECLIKKTKTKTDLGDDAPNKYEIDVHLLEGGSPTVGLRSPTNEGGVVLNSDQGVVLELDTQKKPITKEKKKNIRFDRSTKEFEGITKDVKDLWKATFPDVDVDKALREMKGWLLNPENPERTGNRKFIENWLKKDQDKSIKNKPVEEKEVVNEELMKLIKDRKYE